jgi:nitrate reductase NapA
MPRSYVELHPEDAHALGVNNGDLVELETRRGKLRLSAWLDGRGAPARGSVFVPFFDESLLVNELTLDLVDEFSKQPDYKKCAVSVRKAPPLSKG